MVIFTSVFRIVDLPSVEFDYIFTGKAEPYLPKPIWKSYFCICREDEARLTLFSEEKDAHTESTPKHLQICRFNRIRPVSPGTSSNVTFKICLDISDK
ncbi:unnamed protein product [Hymenolepis diminuta]|uniref:Uncharacterized protein n=1 Tax=Hymenolepis diminuta TaxID=6216 RepID=A0A564YPA6_HYMDI|nr:unnamed protein product [Hymenolepis diminuta]